LLYWPDVLAGVVVLVIGLWSALANVFMLAFLLGEPKHPLRKDPSILDLALLAAAAALCIYSGSQMIPSRKIGLTLALLTGLCFLVWAAINRTWFTIMYVGIALLCYIAGRLSGLIGPRLS